MIPGETEDDFVARIAAKDVPEGAMHVQIVDADAIPEDREFRNAWDYNDEQVLVDIDLAKNLVKDKLRIERAPILASLDIEYQRADEENDGIKKASIVAQKKALRNITADPRIEEATTVEELKQVTIESVLTGE